MTKTAVKFATLSVFLILIITSFAASGINISENNSNDNSHSEL